MRNPRRHDTQSRTAVELASLPGIGDVAALYKLTHRTLRFYEQSGLIAPIRHCGRRCYGPDALRQLDIVVAARRAGFSIREIEEMLWKGQDWATWLGPARLQERIDDLQRRLQDVNDSLRTLRTLLPTLATQKATGV